MPALSHIVVVPWCSKNQHLAVLDTKDRQALTSCSMAQATFSGLGKCSHFMDHRANGPMPQTREHGACSTTQ